jgi:O-antigen/teichoic acid export membrane protein
VSQGRLFLLIQIGATVVWGSNQIILSSVVGPGEAAAFSVVQRLFMVVSMPLAILNAPLWALYADAHAHRESGFIRAALKRSMAISISFSVVGSALIASTSLYLVDLLSKGQVSVPPATIAYFAIWTVFEATGNAFAMYLNGVGVIRPQAITVGAYAFVSVPMKIAGAHYFGATGLLAVMVGSYVLFTILPLTTVFRREWLAPAADNNLNHTV